MIHNGKIQHMEGQCVASSHGASSSRNKFERTLQIFPSAQATNLYCERYILNVPGT